MTKPTCVSVVNDYADTVVNNYADTRFSRILYLPVENNFAKPFWPIHFGPNPESGFLTKKGSKSPDIVSLKGAKLSQYTEFDRMEKAWVSCRQN